MTRHGPAPHPRLLGDVGGTRARFGWVAAAGAGISDLDVYRCDDHSGLEAAIDNYLRAHGRPAAASCALGIATPVTGDRITLTNRNWSFSIAEIRRQLGFERLLVLNDFAALALSLPTLAASDMRQIGGGQAVAGAAIALLGPGTGLGVSGLLPGAGGARAVIGEGGHASLSAADPAEERLLAVLRGRYGHVSAERVLSGAGIEALYRACCEVAGAPAADLSAAEITASALQASDAQCRETLERFFAFLGGFAGNLALTLGARGGVCIGGGIVPRLAGAIDASCFRERFESKGRYRSYLAGIPTWLIVDSSRAALQGANSALDDPGAWDASTASD